MVRAQFGKSSSSGNKEGVYEDVYGTLEQSLATNGPLRGALFWRWSLDGGDDTSVNAGDSVWGCVALACAWTEELFMQWAITNGGA